MRLAVVMSHAGRSTGGVMREVLLCAALREHGVDARIWRMHEGAATERDELRGVPLSFCPVDGAAPLPHKLLSAALCREIAGFAPDVVLYKGLSYAINAQVQAARGGDARYGLIVGGAVADALVPGATVILGEYREQLARHFRAAQRAGRTLVLPKHLDLALAGDGTPPEAPEFDIVNVGTFGETRKNQAALLPLAARWRIAFVGDGALMEDARRAAEAAGHGDRVVFHGRLPHQAVFGVLRRSRMMVHTSLADGLPRAIIEAMACGLPVIALRRTIAGGIPPAGGFLVSDAGLPHAVALLRADDALRVRMGRAARRHVEREHGEGAIARAARALLALLTRAAAPPSAGG